MSKYLIYVSEDPACEPNARIDGLTGRTQTYDEIMYQSIRLAQHLQEKELTNEDVIALCAYNCFDNCIVYLACLFLGIKFSAIDPTLTVDDSVHLLNILKPKFLFCDAESIDLMMKSLIKAKLETRFIVFGELGYSKLLLPTGTEDSFEARPVKDLNETTIIFFSSGTTGLPKGVCCSHYGIVSKFPNKRNSSTFSFVCASFSTFYWISAVAYFNMCLNVGTPRVLYKKFSVELFLNAVQKHQVSFMLLTPYQVYDLLFYPNITSHDLSSIKCVIIGGSLVSKNCILSLRKLLPKSLVANGYGLTEAQGGSSSFDIQKDYQLMQTKINSIGKPSQGFTYKVVDPDTEEVLGSNITGEIRIKSKALMTGYYNDPKSTATAFDEDGFFKTGDMGYYDEDHYFYIVDRLKEMFKYRSQHISPAEVEPILLTHPDVKEAVIIGIPHEVDGNYPMAAVVLKPGATVTEEQILNYFNEQVSDPKKLRAGVKFVTNLPSTSSGKLKRICIRQMLTNNIISN